MNNKRVLITGATAGIGKASALALAKQGAEVILVGRNPTKTERVMNELKFESNNQNIHMLIADLSSMVAVRQLAEDFHAQFDSLDVLLNNAGAVFSEYTQSADGWEMTFALNHMSYFLLTHLLLDTLKQTAGTKGEARIVNVSSDAHQQASSGMKLDTINDKEAFGSFSAYAKSKLANIMFTYELARQLEGTHVTVNALHPGFVNSSFGDNTNGIMSFLVGGMKRFFGKSEADGAATSVYLASSSEVQGVSGKYWSDKQAKKSNGISYDRNEQQRLWDFSMQLVNLDNRQTMTT